MDFDRRTFSPAALGKAILLTAMTALALTGCAVSGAASGVAPTASAAPKEAAVGSGALVPARHLECNFGQKVLKYLATGDNQGDPNLDKIFARHVGASGPEARQIVDDAIEKCDGAADNREATAASASASAEAAAAKASADAQASAAADTARSALLTKEKSACAAIGGRLNPSTVSYDTCDAPDAHASATDGLSCALAQIAFNASGEMGQSDIIVVKTGYPGCFK